MALIARKASNCIRRMKLFINRGWVYLCFKNLETLFHIRRLIFSLPEAWIAFFKAFFLHMKNVIYCICMKIHLELLARRMQSILSALLFDRIIFCAHVSSKIARYMDLLIILNTSMPKKKTIQSFKFIFFFLSLNFSPVGLFFFNFLFCCKENIFLLSY